MTTSVHILMPAPNHLRALIEELDINPDTGMVTGVSKTHILEAGAVSETMHIYNTRIIRITEYPNANHETAAADHALTDGLGEIHRDMVDFIGRDIELEAAFGRWRARDRNEPYVDQGADVQPDPDEVAENKPDPGTEPQPE